MDEQWLRPQACRIARLLVIVLACLWLSCAAFTGAAAVWWPTHGNLDNTPAEWFGGMALLSLNFAWPFALSWLLEGRVSWRVGAGGLAIYRGKVLRRSVAWPDVVSLDVRPFGAIARLRTRPFQVRIHWLSPAEASWLRECFRRQMGEGAEPNATDVTMNIKSVARDDGR